MGVGRCAVSNGGWRSARMGKHPLAWLVHLRGPAVEPPMLFIRVSFDNEEQREKFFAEFLHDVGFLEAHALQAEREGD